MPAYKSYCWSLGTTSFRMVEFNRKNMLSLKSTMNTMYRIYRTLLCEVFLISYNSKIRI